MRSLKWGFKTSVKVFRYYAINIFIIILVNICTVSGSSSFLPEWLTNLFPNFGRSGRLPESITQEAEATTADLIIKHRYPAEVHHVVTEDGYILGIHRIPREGGQPFLLEHGILDSSSAFVLLGPEKSLAYILSDQGYDIWLGNARGNRYSRNHTRLNPEQVEFWNFTFHEIGYYDIPATIDYILNMTNSEELHYIGHSQGATAFFVMCSKRPEYNNKIILMQGLGPIAFLGNTRTGAVGFLEYYLESNAGKQSWEFLPHGFMRNTLSCYRNRNSGFNNRLCLEGLFFVQGYDHRQFNNSLAPVIFGHFPSGTSVRNIRHYLQLTKSEKFAEFDYGSSGNRQIYGRSRPPEYNLSLVTAPVVLYFARNDLISSAEDIHKIYQGLGNFYGLYEVPYSNFNHLDYVLASNASGILYERVTEILRNYSRGFLYYTIE